METDMTNIPFKIALVVYVASTYTLSHRIANQEKKEGNGYLRNEGDTRFFYFLMAFFLPLLISTALYIMGRILYLILVWFFS